ncbi:MAG: hypothetical protein IJW21_06755, partial [Clostridia bacterium]|nr:hypothetical protein [Clostridia bacterium]
AENDLTADSYDKMLNAYIPALRCLYEYKLDAYFYIDCCNLAKAKLKHHERKLEQRIETIENILQDLEMDDVYRYDERQGDRKGSNASLLDLNSAFCSCAKNREFYSIIGTDILEYISVNKNN